MDSIDNRLQNQLSAANVTQMEWEADRRARIRFRLEDGRFQTVYIESKPHTVGRYENRDVWSVCGPLGPDAQATRWLEKNAFMRFGKFGVLKRGGRFELIFKADVRADADPEELLQHLDEVAATADQAEMELSVHDKF